MVFDLLSAIAVALSLVFAVLAVLFHLQELRQRDYARYAVGDGEELFRTFLSLLTPKDSEMRTEEPEWYPSGEELLHAIRLADYTWDKQVRHIVDETLSRALSEVRSR